MQQILKRIKIGMACLAMACYASAQTATHFVAVNFTEKGFSEVLISKVNGKNNRRLADCMISPDQSDFMLAIPQDSVNSYRFQVSLLQPNGRHMKTTKICVLPLKLKADHDYVLNITPSKLDTVKKTGWVLKENNNRGPVAHISGHLNTSFHVPIELQRVEDGEVKSGNQFDVDDAGNFEIGCQVKKEGFYYLSSPRWRVRVYLSPMEHLYLNLDYMTGAIVQSKGSMMNQLLYRWQQLIQPITRYGYNQTMPRIDSVELNDYISDYKKLLPAMKEFVDQIDMTDQHTLELFQNAVAIDRELAPLDFLFRKSAQKVHGFTMQPKEFNEVPEFFKQFVRSGKFGDASILMVGEARALMNLYGKLNIAMLPAEKRAQLTRAEKTKIMIQSVANDTLKSLVFQDELNQEGVNNLSEFKNTFEPFKNYARLPSTKIAYNNAFGQFSPDTAFIGKTSYNFSLPDTSNHMVSMKDFKGKVIFIDVWATWCGPCKEQIPFFKEIEEEYKDNKDIEFVGISIDRGSDRNKWVDMIKKEKMAGVQLLDDTGKSFAKPYQINAIPRFLLIDKKGKWIEIRCPRPSDKEALKTYLNRALKEKV